ncbi:hypothetical protein Aasi_0902 [Candidatus Amoebophilus asiaticus 5a2]|uniref:ABC transporter related n=1 Tax=Amoebophilus asiaticus (strain 5a2) TaxID=452471 RepID=B3ESR7_AMOA5|nr:ABC transporter ATP-binding protein [Candidatus Amoebophilus asiaticus]ACE06269.1 hypothetical protein Aasi_0902 [Candidatus Amoebophilus asiaticus 5a2]
MSKIENYKLYKNYISEILISTFKDKKICFSFTIAILGLCLEVLLSLSIPIVFKKVVESFSSSSPSFITLILLSYSTMWVFSQASIQLRTLVTYKVEQRITFTLGVKVLSHLYGLSHNYFLNQKTGVITSIIQRAQQDVPSIILGLFLHVLPTILQFTCTLVVIATLYPLTYSFLMSVILMAIFIYNSFFTKRISKARERANETNKNASGIITDWLLNHEAINVFGNKELAIHTCGTELKKREVAEVEFMSKYTLYHLGQTLILGLGLTSFTYLIGQGILKGSLTAGDFILFNGYILQFLVPIGILGRVTQNIKKALIDMRGVLDLLLTKSEITEAPQPAILLDSCFQIHFENVYFKYENRNVLEDISFKIESGTTVLIVGRSGIGKSTIAKLMLRLFDPTEGQIYINQINIKLLSLKWLRETISWVPQETYLLNDTIKNNLLFVHPEATFNEIEEALEQACLLNHVKSLPQGLDTVVGDRGLKLSGGEKQRLSLARLFIKKPKICILDEYTSALDKDTESIIQTNIEKYIPNMTKIIITHRPILNMKVDQVISLSYAGIALD